MKTNETPAPGTNTVVGATQPHETPEKNLSRAAGTAAPPMSSNEAREGDVTTRSDDTTAAANVTSETISSSLHAVSPREMTAEMRDWLSTNVETYEKIMMHAFIHDPNLREMVMRLGLTHKDFSSGEPSLLIEAFKKAAMMQEAYGVEIPVPANPVFLAPHVAAAAFDQEVDDLVVASTIALIDKLQIEDYSSMHGLILPCLAAWFGAKRAKRAAHQIMMFKLPEVHTIVDNLKDEIDAADGLSMDIRGREFDFDHEPVPPDSIIALAGKTIGTPGNLLTIQGPIKSCKSTVVEGIMAAALRLPCVACDTLGIYVAHSDGRALLHFDTEQSKHDHHRLLRRAYKRAKRQKKANWLRSYHLTGMDTAACWKMLMLAIKSAVKDHGSIMMIVVDGIADFCKDPNDAGECFDLVRKFHRLAVEHECVIIGVIHENPGNGGGKTRGHLGSQLDRKSETSLRLQKDTKTGVAEMWVERGRSCFIPKSEGIRFRWCPDSQMHVTLHASEGDVAGASVDRFTRFSHEVAKVFIDDERLNYSALVEKIMVKLNRAQPTAKERVAEYVAHGLIEKDDAGTYRLARPTFAE